MRVLMLASYFSKPDNPTMGNWALAQAQAFRAAGMAVRVVSGTSWVPPVMARTPGARAYANCPKHHQWDGLDVYYPRWPFYSFPQMYQSLAENPRLQIRPVWWAIRGVMLRHVDEFQPDVIYAHHSQINGYIACQIRKLRGLPYVITDHDFGELEACLNYPRRREFLRETFESSGRMVAVAKRMEEIVRRAYPAARAETIHNGTVTPPPEIFELPRPAELAKNLVVFSAAAFYERKGLPLLIDCFAEVARTIPNSVLRIAGDGPDRAAVDAAIIRASLGNRVQLLGKLPHHQVLQEMAWSDVFALAGWNEPFATAYSEALSTGCPIIYGSDGGITDVVRDGIHGIAVQPRSRDSLTVALRMMLSDDELRRRMSMEAKQLYAGGLMWRHNAIRMESVFQDVMRGGH